MVEIKCAYTKMMPIDEILLNESNRNIHPNEQIERLAKIIDHFGLRHPVIINNENICIAGAGRLLSLKLLGETQVPVDIQEFKDGNEAQQFGIADNEISRWAEPDLAAINLDILDWGPDFDIDLLGILDFEIEPADKYASKEDQEDDVPEVKDTRAKPGDLWILGNHRLLCGDATNVQHVDKLMGGEKADMVFTDPPYNIAYGQSKNPKWGSKWNGKHDGGAIINDNMSAEDFKQFCTDWATTLMTVCDGCFYVWGPPGKDGRIMFMVLDELLHCSTTIIWNKDRMTLGRGKYQNKYEPCWFGWNKDGGSFANADRSITNVWDMKRPSVNDLHPTMKPIELVQRGIEDASTTGGRVLDVFGGSGSTLIACEKTNRNCFMMEIDCHYVSVIIERWQKYAEKDAYLLKDDGSKVKYADLSSVQ